MTLPKQEELTLFYDFFGSETDSLFLDGQKLAELPGVGEGKLKQNQIFLGALKKGEHRLSITTDGGNGVHFIDYLKLQGTIMIPSREESPDTNSLITPKKNSVLLTTGLEDYGQWVAMYQNHKRNKKEKPFRRGRIWS